LLEYDPVLNQSVELVLIVDGREDKKSSSGRKSIGEHLIKRGIIHEMRQLAVGDYLWILKLGVGCENEMVMDFVVERKTWDDLKV
jgi:ERCC4-type nuclease